MLPKQTQKWEGLDFERAEKMTISVEEMVRNGYAASPSSSPPTPPSPLPVSIGPGHQKYSFSASPTPSPPFSPPSSRTSVENLPFLPARASSRPSAPSAFSLDLPKNVDSDSSSSCLQDLLDWFVQRCCSCCSQPLFSSSKVHP